MTGFNNLRKLECQRANNDKFLWVIVLAVLILSFFLSGCAVNSKTAITVLPSAARIIEASRDAESFNDPISNRSDTWHRLKYVQYPLWGLWGYYTITEIKENPKAVESYVLPVLSIGLAWASFELTLQNKRGL